MGPAVATLVVVLAMEAMRTAVLTLSTRGGESTKAAARRRVWGGQDGPPQGHGPAIMASIAVMLTADLHTRNSRCPRAQSQSQRGSFGGARTQS
mmetsp:Transcript_100489/g.146697  ORF Transcript_100489/g.146697 Transcript_100489/m.146697 type:complete len:94 (+) Transcript_100489:241-522(+)